ncbi:hypothetical protein LDC_0468 [sediment metagenome]|uniref:DNA (cytosine-5-)-methyltransferase n=1 Tax=sediment metagenome TaxID=749907 RepID=D9PG23_9ZZZZ
MNNFISQNYPIKILDIFSGSGCIGLSILNNLENVSVDFADIKNEIFYKLKKI